MAKKHLKRLAAPKTWHIKRKRLKFIIRPVPGAHSLDRGLPLGLLLKEILNHANTTSEVKKILNNSEIKIDGKIRKDVRFSVGIFDTIEFTNINEYFRVILNRKGKLDLIKINKDEAVLKPCKIIGKTMVRGKLQLNLFDGKNIFVDNNNYKVGDTVILSLPDKHVEKHLKLDKKSTIFLTGGKHIGEIGNVEDIIEDKIVYKDKDGELVETSKRYAFVIEYEPNERH